MKPSRFGIYTGVGTLGFYAATGAVIYYARQQSLFAAVVAVATDRTGLATVGGLALLGIGLFVRNWVRR